MKSELSINYPFYLIHGTKDINSILSILKNKKIKIGKNLKIDERKFGGIDPLDYVYANIYFEDLNNLSHLWDFSIILHPKILIDYNGIFNKGWPGHPVKDSIHFNKSDSLKIFNKKINDVRKFVKNPESLPKIVKDSPGLLHHEIIFDQELPIENYIIGIVCNHCPNELLEKIKNNLKKYLFSDIKIITKNYPLPTLEYLIY